MQSIYRKRPALAAYSTLLSAMIRWLKRLPPRRVIVFREGCIVGFREDADSPRSFQVWKVLRSGPWGTASQHLLSRPHNQEAHEAARRQQVTRLYSMQYRTRARPQTVTQEKTSIAEAFPCGKWRYRVQDLAKKAILFPWDNVNFPA